MPLPQRNMPAIGLLWNCWGDSWNWICGNFLQNVSVIQFNRINIVHPSSVLQYFVDYYGGIFSYLIQIFPIFIFNWYQGLGPGELAEQISNVSSMKFMKFDRKFWRMPSISSTWSIVFRVWQISSWIWAKWLPIHRGFCSAIDKDYPFLQNISFDHC